MCCKIPETFALRLALRGYRSQHFHGHDFLYSTIKTVHVAHELNPPLHMRLAKLDFGRFKG